MNKKYKYLIIGSGIAGTTAAETIRENDKNGSIAIVSQEKYPLYSKVVLSNFLEGKISEKKVFLRTKNSYEEKNIDLILGVEVLSLDAKNKKVILNDKQEILCKKLLIATGASSKKLKTETVDKSDISYFQNFDDARNTKEKMLNSKNAVIVGGGFNVLEIAEAFYKNNIKTSILLRGENLLGKSFDKESNEIIRKNLKEREISLFFNEEIKKVNREIGKKILISKSGKKYNFDILVVGIGVKRNIDFIINSGLKINKGIIVNEFLEASEPDIFAAGDIAEFYDVVLNKQMLLRNWTSAFLQGKTAGLNMLGKKTIFRHISGYNVVNFGINISFLGDVQKNTKCPSGKNTVLISRGNILKKERMQLFLRNGHLVGVTHINMNREMGALVQLIENKVNLSGYLDKLKDSNFDLNKLIKK
jgi:3-phenylpropionate/trans-cinnamate dioxygenase ferredoxin reductase subunit